MKLQAELDELVRRITPYHNQGKIQAHRELLAQNDRIKDIEVRLAWDLLRAVYTSSEICSWYDKYECNDDHITTLAKKAIKIVEDK